MASKRKTKSSSIVARLKPGLGIARVIDLSEAEYNPRRIDPDEFAKLCRSIREFGFVEPAVVRVDGLIIGGHQRVAAYRSNAEEDGVAVADLTIPVFAVDVDDARAKVLNLALNRIAGEWDVEKLAGVFESLGHDWSAELHGLAGFDARELDDVYAHVADAAIDDDRSSKDEVGSGRAGGDDEKSGSEGATVRCPHCGGEVEIDVAGPR